MSNIVYGAGRHFKTGEPLPRDPATGEYLSAAEFDAQKAAQLETAKVAAREAAKAAARSQATGPRTPQGKAVSARNATTHGLFARDVVLPALGEDPAAYECLFARLTEELAPRTLLERQYVEKIAAASWRLRRYARWEAQVWEDQTLSESERQAKLDSVARHETTLYRQIDTAVKMLRREVCPLFLARARADALDSLKITEEDCRGRGDQARLNTYHLTALTEQCLDVRDLPAAFTPGNLDNTHAAEPPPETREREICGNELPPPDASAQEQQQEVRPSVNIPVAQLLGHPCVGAHGNAPASSQADNRHKTGGFG